MTKTHRALLLALAALLLCGCEFAFGATLYVDASKGHPLESVAWGSGSLPPQPSFMWIFGNGTTFNYIGGLKANGYVNSGADALTTQLVGGASSPDLAEGWDDTGEAGSTRSAI